MFISSRDNQKVKDYIRLRDKKQARDAENAFVLEGVRLIDDAISQGVSLISAFYTEYASKRFSDTVKRLCSLLGENACMISEDVSSKLCDTVAPQGIYAVASRLDKNPRLDKIVYGGKYLILNSLRDPGNVGTVLRAADAVGITGIYLCDCCDTYNPKLVRSTMGSLFRVPFDDTLDYRSAVIKLKSFGAKVYASVVDKDAESLKSFTFPKTCAVVIGNEGSGLSKEDADMCDKRITIKMSGTIESLNAAAAATIFLWELTK